MKFCKIAGSALTALLVFFISAVHISAAAPSGKLPVLHIDTENNTPITSKEEYLPATYYLDPCGIEGVEAFGTAESPLPLQIRGRGNYTWVGFDKKPYRVKFDSKTPLLGMKKSKHFALLAHADDNLGFLRNTLGMELSRRMGLKWTPGCEPVEVVLNGDYIGLYFLTETIRVDKDRVNIVEQADNETDPERITGGWLVEIDNYDSDPHVSIQENGSIERIIFTYKTPEVLSEAQEEYLRTQVQAMDDAIYTADKNSTLWQDYIDIDELARYYIVQEIMDDCESFHGSCYMYRNMGADRKWLFGPVWDFGNAFHRGNKSKFIYEEPAFHQTWIGEIARYPAFQAKVREVWADFAASGSDDLYDWLDSEIARISAAAVADGERWPDYSNADMATRGASMKDLLKHSVKWLGAIWGADVPDQLPAIYLRGNFNEWSTSHPLARISDGIYAIEGVNIEKDPAGDNKFKIATSDWKTVDLGATKNVEFVIGEEYPLEVGGGNIELPRSVSNATFRLDYNRKMLLVTDDQSGSAPSVGDGEKSFSVAGRVLTANVPTTVYNVSGQSVWQGTGSVELMPAVYIIRSADGRVSKLLIH